MIGCHRLTCGAHSCCIASPCPAHADLCRCLIAWTGKLHIDTFLQWYLKFFCRFSHFFLQFRCIHLTHIRKSRSEFVNIFSDQWIRDRSCDVICDEHKISRFEVVIHTACCVGQNDLFCPQKSHKACWKHYIRHRISLIIVHTSLHDHHRNALHMGKHKSSLMSFHRGYRKTFDIRVIDRCLDFQIICVIPKSGT